MECRQNRRPSLGATLLVIVLAGAAWSSPAEPEKRKSVEPTFDCSEVGGVSYLLKRPTLLLLGEIHGTVESPKFVADLLCNVVSSGRSATVALQLPEFESDVVDVYLSSEGSAEDREVLLKQAQELTLYEDGRFSEAMFGLVESIRSLRAGGGQIEVLLFVPSDLDSLTRRKPSHAERPMAERLWSAIDETESDLFIVLAGLAHSRVIRGTPLDPDFQPMGYLLSQWHSDWRLLSLALSHSGGTAWICTSSHVSDCRAVPVLGGGWGAPSNIYIYGEVTETGHDGVYFVGDISHSPPAKIDGVEPEFDQRPVIELPLDPAPNP